MTTASIVIETLDGRIYMGTSELDAIDAMRAAAWGCPGQRSRIGYMRSVAWRVGQWNKRHVRTDSPSEFLEDLQAAGVVIVRRVQ